MQIIKNLSYFLLLIILMNSLLLAQNTNNNLPLSSSPESIFNQGLQQLQKGNINEAIRLLEKLLSYNTQNPNYYIYLGYLHYVAGNYDQAINVLNKSLEFNNNLLITHLMLGEIYYQLNKIVESREEYKKVVEMNDNIKLAHIRLYELYKDNNPTEANSHYIKIFQLPTTKIERFLPDIDKIGDITIPFNNNIVVLKDNYLEKRIQTNKEFMDKIFQETINSTNTNRSEIIATIKNNKFSLNLNFSFLTSPFTNIDKENFSIKLIEFIIISIFLYIFNMFQRKSEKGFYRVVLSQYRVSAIKKEEK